jgi:hypothetical protein
MAAFEVNDEVAALIEKLARHKPFENLSFNSALLRVLTDYQRLLSAVSQKPTGSSEKPKRVITDEDYKAILDHIETINVDEFTTRGMGSVGFKKAASPSAAEWAKCIPELKSVRGLNKWKDICRHLKIRTGGDSALRVLSRWVRDNRPDWQRVPGPC